MEHMNCWNLFELFLHMLCYYTYQYVVNEKQLKLIFGWSGIGVAIITLIGIFQYFGMDIFRSSFGKHLITNPSDWNRLDDFNFQVSDKVVYCTLYNQNFLSFYFGIMIPLIFFIIIATKKIWIRVLLICLEAAGLFCLIGSNSDSGWIALTSGCIIAFFILLSRNKKALFTGVCIFIVGCIVFGVVFSNTSVGQRLITTIKGTYHVQDLGRLDSFDTDDDYVSFNIDGNKLQMSYSVDENQEIKIVCEDENEKEIAKTLIDSNLLKYELQDLRFQGITLMPMWYGSDTLAIMVSIDGRDWSFVNVDGKGYYYYNPAGKLVKYHGVKSADLFREDAFSGRGRIWNLTIPLLGKHVLLGSGANTFMFEYPQNDYIYHFYVSGSNIYDVKAHCWYLQQWVETGLIGTIALLIFIGCYIIKSIKIYRRADLHESISLIGFGLFVAILVYLITALVNDSNVCTAPVFWGILGMGLAVNRMIIDANGLLAKKETMTDISDCVCSVVKTPSIAENQKGHTKSSVYKKQSRKKRKNQKKEGIGN